MEENNSMQEITEEQINYIIEESNLELNKLYIEFELLKRRIQRAESEVMQLKELLPKKKNEGEEPLAENKK